jgi:hypothetical protein
VKVTWVALFSILPLPAFTADVAYKPSDISRAVGVARKTIVGLDIRFQVSTRVVRGSFTESAKREYPGASPTEVPDHDITLSYENRALIDFTTGRYAMDGYTPHFKLKTDSNNRPLLESYGEFAHSAFDGTRFYMLRPKQKLDPRSIPPGIKYPVEFLQLETKDGGTIGAELYPIYIWAGTFIIHDDELKAVECRPTLDLSGCKIVGPVLIDGSNSIVVTTRAASSGAYSDLVLEMGSGLRPKTWTRYWRDGHRSVTELRYSPDATNIGVPALVSWSVHDYDASFGLKRQSTVIVQSFIINPSFDKDGFRLSPSAGMVVQRGIDKSTVFTVAGQPDVVFRTNYDLNRTIEGSRWGWGSILAVIGGIGLALVAVLVVRKKFYCRA